MQEFAIATTTLAVVLGLLEHGLQIGTKKPVFVVEATILLFLKSGCYAYYIKLGKWEYYHQNFTD